jgi:hypothetical protein
MISKIVGLGPFPTIQASSTPVVVATPLNNRHLMESEVGPMGVAVHTTI